MRTPDWGFLRLGERAPVMKLTCSSGLPILEVTSCTVLLGPFSASHIVPLLSFWLSRPIGLWHLAFFWILETTPSLSQCFFYSYPIRYFVLNLSSVISSLDPFPSCSLFYSGGVTGRFNSWSCADSQRDSAEQMSEILLKFWFKFSSDLP